MGPLPSPSLAVLSVHGRPIVRCWLRGRPTVLLTSGQLLWVAKGAHFSEAGLRIPLSTIERHTASLIKSPFGNAAEFLFFTPNETQPRASVRFARGSALAAVDMFSPEVATAIAANAPSLGRPPPPTPLPEAPPLPLLCLLAVRPNRSWLRWTCVRS